MLLPSAWTASIVHDLTALPSTMTVHAPQFDVSHPMCVPVRFRSSRMKCTSSKRGSTSAEYDSPLTVTLTFARSTGAVVMLCLPWRVRSLDATHGAYARVPLHVCSQPVPGHLRSAR